MITQTQNNTAANKAAMDAAVGNASSNSNGFGGGGDDMQNKPLPSFQKLVKIGKQFTNDVSCQ